MTSMQSMASSLKPSRFQIPGTRIASAMVLFALGAAALGAAMVQPGKPSVDVASVNTTPRAGALVERADLSEDGTIGNAGGDPYAFFVFSRDDKIAPFSGAFVTAASR